MLLTHKEDRLAGQVGQARRSARNCAVRNRLTKRGTQPGRGHGRSDVSVVALPDIGETKSAFLRERISYPAEPSATSNFVRIRQARTEQARVLLAGADNWPRALQTAY